MVKMQDGKRMAADVYRPKDTSKKVLIIFARSLTISGTSRSRLLANPADTM
jgi:predicted acyl esterase